MCDFVYSSISKEFENRKDEIRRAISCGEIQNTLIQLALSA